jgi:hypothetical protein
MYFPSLNASSLDWDPLVLNAFESAELNVAEENELTKIRDDRKLEVKRSSIDMGPHSGCLRQEYPVITKKAIEALHPFSTSYQCEAGFSAMNATKPEIRSRLQTLEEDFRLCLSTIRTRKREIVRHREAQASH